MRTQDLPDAPDAGDSFEPLLTEAAAAKLIGVSSFTLARLRKAGLIAFHRPGGHLVRYSASDVAMYISRTRRPSNHEKAA